MKKMSTKQLLAESAGWYGTAAILAAFVLVSFNLIAGDGLIFQLLNLTGALGIITIASYKRVRQSVVLNVIWGVVAVIATIRIFI